MKCAVEVFIVVAVMTAIACGVCWVGIQIDKRLTVSKPLQQVQFMDKPGHIIVQVEGKDLRVRSFTPDIKVQWVSEADK